MEKHGNNYDFFKGTVEGLPLQHCSPCWFAVLSTSFTKMMSSRKDFKKPVQLETFGEERHSVVPYF